MTTVATLRLRFLTFKHHAHKNFMTFLNRPDAVQYVRGGVCIGGEIHCPRIVFQPTPSCLLKPIKIESSNEYSIAIPLIGLQRTPIASVYQYVANGLPREIRFEDLNKMSLFRLYRSIHNLLPTILALVRCSLPQ